MFTAAELKAVPLFAGVEDLVLDQLARNVADIHLLAGEYVAHEGERGALYVIIEGRGEVTKIIEGVERVIGVRGPGELFGEVPVVLNTPFLASLRATEPSRVVCIAPQEFHVLAAAAPDVAKDVGAAALDRIGGLQDLAAEPPPPELLVVGSRWDPACHDIRDFLQRNQVPYEWLTPDDAGAASVMARANGISPSVRLRDGSVLATPSRREIARAVGLSIAPKVREYDVVIVGGGPAGMAAAVYGASEGLSAVLIERQVPGGQAGQSSRIENYLGFPIGVSGEELANRALQQARRFGAEIVVTRQVQAIDSASGNVLLDDDEQIHARTVILALGVTYRRLAIDGADRLNGRGIYYGAAMSEASSTQGQDVFLVGAGNSAGQAALYFANYARSVTILVRGDSLAKSMSYYLIEQLKTKSNISVELRSEVSSVHGSDHLEAIDILLVDTGKATKRATTGLFAFIGADTDTAWLPDDVERDARGFILTGMDVLKSNAWPLPRQPHLLETSVPGIFAAGDIRAGSVKRVAAGVGEGSMAIAFVHQYLQAQERVRTA